MACVPHPPPEVAAIIAASPGSEGGPRFRAVNRRAAHYVDAAGALDFTCFKHSIRVRLTIQTPGVRFAQRFPVSFAYRLHDPKRPVTRHVRQFPGGIHRLEARTVAFTYRNASNCGIRHGPPACPTSAYGLSIADARGRVRNIDPPIGNGGNDY